jgi:hypothetical protein
MQDDTQQIHQLRKLIYLFCSQFILCLYNLLMNSFEQKGISNHFARQLINFNTDYKHAQYVGFFGVSVMLETL